MKLFKFRKTIVAVGLACVAASSWADLNFAYAITGPVALSVDGVGSNAAAVGNVQANIPVGAPILKAYLYSAGLPSPLYAQAPTTLAAYNASGITLAGTSPILWVAPLLPVVPLPLALPALSVAAPRLPRFASTARC